MQMRPLEQLWPVGDVLRPLSRLFTGPLRFVVLCIVCVHHTPPTEEKKALSLPLTRLLPLPHSRLLRENHDKLL